MNKKISVSATVEEKEIIKESLPNTWEDIRQRSHERLMEITMAVAMYCANMPKDTSQKNKTDECIFEEPGKF